MPFNIADCVNNFVNRAIKSPIVYNIFESPLYTALAIVLVVVVVIMIVFRDAEMDESLVVASARVGFWSFFAISAIMYINAKVLDKERIENNRTGGFSTLFGDDGTYEMHDGYVPIAPVREPGENELSD